MSTTTVEVAPSSSNGLTSHRTYPPFPAGLPSAPLTTISLSRLLGGDSREADRVFESAKSLGFFYLDLLGVSETDESAHAAPASSKNATAHLGAHLVATAEKLQRIGGEFMDLPHAEKEEYSQAKIGEFFAYKWVEREGWDARGERKRNQTYNVKKDSILSTPNAHCPPVHPLVAAEQATFESFIHACRTITDRLLSILEAHLGLASHTLSSIHRLDRASGDHVRFNRTAMMAYDPVLARASEHTDFGSLTLLFNWLGGLQIRMPPTTEGVKGTEGAEGEWVWVPPRPGCCVVNLGDALVKFSAGILRSNIHRVVPPPGPQAGLERFSLVYFCRPEDNVILKRLQGGIIDARPKQEGNDEGITAREWVFRRSGGDLKGVYTHTGGLESRL